MNTNLISLIIIILVICLLFCILKKKNNKKVQENFSFTSFVKGIGDLPGELVGDNMGEVWTGGKDLLVFGRNIYYNVVPNYTWFTRYADKRNDWIRANKGLPPLLPTPANNAEMKFNINTNTKNKEQSWNPLGYFQAMMY